jgi:MFS family permease
MLNRLRSTYQEYPRAFWTLTGASFVDRIGSTALWPFFSLYITQKFDVGMTEAGLLFGIFSISSFIGSLLGGALADRFGRKVILLFGLIVSALSGLMMGFVNHLGTFFVLAAFTGVLSDIAGPAREAMVADLLPEEKRAEGFGVLRVAGNLAWIFGPTIGGIIGAYNYLWLFVLDSVTSLITAGIVYLVIPETRPETEQAAQGESIGQTFRGYGTVLRDRIFVAFIGISVLMSLVYFQMYSTLSVYLRDVHGVPARGYGYLMSMNALMVVLFQFPLTRRLRPYRPMILMASGTIFYLIGFTLYGFVNAYAFFAVAMLTITFGEMIVIPTSSALVARLAPQDMRGRYLALSGLTWVVAASVGPTVAGLLIDNYNPNWLWYLCGVVCAVAVIGFLLLDARTDPRLEPRPLSETETAVA